MNNKEYLDLVNAGEYPQEQLVPLDEPYIDKRGMIQNIIPTISIITSKAGTERSNHWHKNDHHYLYVISGSMEYYERPAPVDGEAFDIVFNEIAYKPLIVKAGQMVFTPPMKLHKTVFLEDTVLLSCSKLPRDHEHHEADVIRAKF